MIADPMILTPVESSTQEYTDGRTEWRYNDTLPHDLLVPHPNDRQCVPLYDRVSGNNNVTIKEDDGDRAFSGDEEMYLETKREQYQTTGTKHDQRTWEHVGMMRHPTSDQSNLANKKQFLKFIKEFQEGNFALL